MDSFTGMRALRKTIELILGRLNMYQETMNEISREELLEIMANNDLDLSWIASQESVDKLMAEVAKLGRIVTKINEDTMRTIGTAAERDIFKFSISGSYVLLYGYNSMPTDDIIIYSQYTTETSTYSTKLQGTGSSGQEMEQNKCKSITIQSGVTLDNGSNVVVKSICAENPNLQSVHIGKLIGYTEGNKSKRYISSYNGQEHAFGMFALCTNLSEVVIQNLTVKNAVGMFDSCKSLTTLDLTGLTIYSTGQVDEMFYGCTNLKEILVSRKNFPESFASSTNMFTGCGVDHVTYVD